MRLSFQLLHLLLMCELVFSLSYDHDAFAKRNESMQERLEKDKPIRQQKLLLDQAFEVSKLIFYH